MNTQDTVFFVIFTRVGTVKHRDVHVCPAAWPTMKSLPFIIRVHRLLEEATRRALARPMAPLAPEDEGLLAREAQLPIRHTG